MPAFVILPVAQITLTWLLALAHERTSRKEPLIAGILLNLASLGTFKYLDFALQSVEVATGLALPRAQIVLPIGISFFSFQLISYLVGPPARAGADLSLSAVCAVRSPISASHCRTDRAPQRAGSAIR